MYINNQQPVAKTNKQTNYNEYTSIFFFIIIIILFSFMVSFLNRASWADKNGNCCVYTQCWTYSFKLTLEGQASITPSSLHLSGSTHGLFCWYHHVKGTRLPSVHSPNILWIPKKKPCSIFHLQVFGCTKVSQCEDIHEKLHNAPLLQGTEKIIQDQALGVMSEEGNKPQGLTIRTPGCSRRWEHFHATNPMLRPQTSAKPLWPHLASSTVALHRSAHLHKGLLRSS